MAMMATYCELNSDSAIDDHKGPFSFMFENNKKIPYETE